MWLAAGIGAIMLLHPFSWYPKFNHSMCTSVRFCSIDFQWLTKCPLPKSDFSFINRLLLYCCLSSLIVARWPEFTFHFYIRRITYWDSKDKSKVNDIERNDRNKRLNPINAYRMLLIYFNGTSFSTYAQYTDHPHATCQSSRPSGTERNTKMQTFYLHNSLPPTHVSPTDRTDRSLPVTSHQHDGQRSRQTNIAERTCQSQCAAMCL